MSIRPVDLNGMIQRTQDVGQIKQQEDQKPFVDQQNISMQSAKEQEQNRNQVVKAGKTEEEEFHYDAKEKGSSEYQGNGKKRGKKDNREEIDGKVVIKGMSGGFDIKI